MTSFKNYYFYRMPKSLLIVAIIFMLTENTFGQKVIYGKVSDGTTNESLPTVNVFVNNTTLGTITNEDGKYALVIPAGEYEVVFSFVGYQSNKVKASTQVADSIRIDIKLFHVV